MQPNLMIQVPAVEPDELAYLQALIKDLSQDKLKLFVTIYNGNRKKTEIILLCCILGFVGAAGIQRFLTGQIGMGILYFFTAGLCLIGTIVGIINHKQLAFEYNQQMANESMNMIRNF